MGAFGYRIILRRLLSPNHHGLLRVRTSTGNLDVRFICVYLRIFNIRTVAMSHSYADISYTVQLVISSGIFQRPTSSMIVRHTASVVSDAQSLEVETITTSQPSTLETDDGSLTPCWPSHQRKPRQFALPQRHRDMSFLFESFSASFSESSTPST